MPARRRPWQAGCTAAATSGQLIFLDLRDRYGITQVVVDAAESPAAHAVASGVRSEYVLRVSGAIARRREGTENPRLATGDVELRAERDRDPRRGAHAALRRSTSRRPRSTRPCASKYRYLDLRREPLQQRILARARLVQAIRDVHHEAGFVEIETPLLIKSTPEGARDFIVPSRLQPGRVYALPQSPQQLKQLLMVSGFDRYFQIARCLRDEDLRGDRQPEFTQLDLEMSFVGEDDVMAWVERMALAVTRAVAPDRPILADPFPRFTYREAIDRFGSDKPDVRFGMELHDLGAAGRGVADSASSSPLLGAGGRVVGLAVPGPRRHRAATSSTSSPSRRGAPVPGGSCGSPSMARALPAARSSRSWARSVARPISRPPRVAARATSCSSSPTPTSWPRRPSGALRVRLAERVGGSSTARVLSYVWVHHFPMYQWDAEHARWDATHNPFSAVHPEDIDAPRDALGRPAPRQRRRPGWARRALQYDIALNGWELGGGSVRFHTREMLSRSFSLMGHSPEAQEAKFSGILEAFEYGAPPHGGIALGSRPLDRPAHRADEHPRGHGLPQDLVGLGPHARCAVAGRARTARGAGPRPRGAGPGESPRGRRSPRRRRPIPGVGHRPARAARR